jgi:hypothetical protein
MSISMPQFSTIRIDVILSSGAILYLFVDESNEAWDPWWGRLYSFLSSLAGPNLNWIHEPVQGVFYARRVLSKEETAALLQLVRQAPDRVVNSHKALTRLVEELSRSGQFGDVLFFRDAKSSGSN